MLTHKLLAVAFASAMLTLACQSSLDLDQYRFENGAAGQGGQGVTGGSMGGSPELGGSGGTLSGSGGSSGGGGGSAGAGGGGMLVGGGGTGAVTPSEELCMPRVASPVTVDFDDLFGDISLDRASLDPDDQPFTRYVGLVNRHDAGAPPCELAADRAALFTALNSLSTNAMVAAPPAIDAANLIYRIDIRAYDWDRTVAPQGRSFTNGWEALVANNVYAVPWVGEEADDLVVALQTLVPYMSADALVARAMTDSLYYALLDVPAVLDQLLREDLLLDRETNLADDNLARAGTTMSAATGAERAVERHDANTAAAAFAWLSFDLSQDVLNESIFLDPLGAPSFERSEVIFSLPNGVPAYAMFDAAGNRVGAELAPGGIVNPVSCLGCHVSGPLPVIDEVLAFVLANQVAFDNETYESVLETYPEQDQLDAIVSSDQQRVATALARIGVDASGPEPIGRALGRFNAPLALADVAGELGVSAEELAGNLRELDSSLQGLATGGTIERAQWTAVFLDSLCVMSVVLENQPAASVCSL